MVNVTSASNQTQTTFNSGSITSNAGSAEDLSNMFLELLVAQVSHQNPLDPMDGTEYVSQLAEFSSVESLQSLRADSERSLNMQQSQQVLQASSLIGKQVSIESDQIELTENAKVAGHIELQAPASEVTVRLYDSEGKIVASKHVEPTNSGVVAFDFDSHDAGHYHIEVQALNNGRLQPSKTFVNGEVLKVSVGDSVDQISLMVQGLGSHSLLDVEQFSTNRG